MQEQHLLLFSIQVQVQLKTLWCGHAQMQQRHLRVWTLQVLTVRIVPSLSRSKGRQTGVAKNLQKQSGTKAFDSEYEERRRNKNEEKYFLIAAKKNENIPTSTIEGTKKNKFIGS
jgi:hypothetical protein